MPWYLKKLKKDMSHCFLLEHQLLGGYDHIIQIENLTNIVEVTTYLAPLQDVLSLIDTTRHYKLISVDMDVDPLKHHNPLGLLYCVSLVKKLLGINKPWIFTPYQLYKYLKEL